MQDAKDIKVEISMEGKQLVATFTDDIAHIRTYSARSMGRYLSTFNIKPEQVGIVRGEGVNVPTVAQAAEIMGCLASSVEIAQLLENAIAELRKGAPSAAPASVRIIKFAP